MTDSIVANSFEPKALSMGDNQAAENSAAAKFALLLDSHTKASGGLNNDMPKGSASGEPESLDMTNPYAQAKSASQDKGSDGDPAFWIKKQHGNSVNPAFNANTEKEGSGMGNDPAFWAHKGDKDPVSVAESAQQGAGLEKKQPPTLDKQVVSGLPNTAIISDGGSKKNHKEGKVGSQEGIKEKDTKPMTGPDNAPAIKRPGVDNSAAPKE
jgi:hypothetical protein